MKKTNLEKKPLTLAILLFFGISLMFILNRFIDIEKINALISILVFMGVIVYIGWINTSIINLKKRVNELEIKKLKES